MRRLRLFTAVFALGGCSTPAPAPDPAPAPPVEEAPIPAPRAPRQAPVVVNRPPVIKQLRVSPEEPNFGDDIHVEVVASDPEGVGLTYAYTWKINGHEDLLVHQPTFRPEQLHKGDKVSVTVTAHDDEQDSEPVSIEVTCRGLPPVMDTTPGQINHLDNVRMRAHDPDNGTLVWSMTGAPAGMSIDPDGLLHYTGSLTEPGGKYQITIIATDPDGDFAKMDLPVTLSPGSKASTPDAAPGAPPAAGTSAANPGTKK